MPTNCLNCQSALADDYKFCPHCGQTAVIHRLTMAHVFQESIHFFTHADKSLLILLKQLVIHTGRVAREYVEGKRRKYFPALNFYLIVLGIFVIMEGLVTSPASTTQKEYPQTQHIPDPVKKAEVNKIYQRRDNVTYFTTRYANVIGMIAVPMIALLYRLFYRRGRYNYTEHFVACMYMGGLTNLVFALVLIPISHLLELHGLTRAIVLGVIQVIYFSIFYYHFIDKGTAGSAVKATFVSLAATIFWFALSGFIISMYIRNGWWGLV